MSQISGISGTSQADRNSRAVTSRGSRIEGSFGVVEVAATLPFSRNRGKCRRPCPAGLRAHLQGLAAQPAVKDSVRAAARV